MEKSHLNVLKLFFIIPHLNNNVLKCVLNFFQHEEFVLKKLHNDIAIIKLDRPLDFGSNAVKPVGALSNKRFDRRAEAFPEQCFSAGWGISNNGKSFYISLCYFGHNGALVEGPPCDH